MKNFAIYIRVSTRKQGNSGLGLEAQRRVCLAFIKSQNGQSVSEFQDVESGTHRNRKGLQEAINYCQKNGCGLVIAKLDRLARDVEFCFRVVNTGIEIHFCDMPQMNTLLLGVFASVAQYERELTSERTKKALAAKKERGEVTGGACEKWQLSYKLKSKEEKELENMKRGKLKNERHMESRDVKSFIKILRCVFPDATKSEDLTKWRWKDINTKEANRSKIFAMMQDYKDIDGFLFLKWNFDDTERKLHVKLASYIWSLKKSAKLMAKRECKGVV